MVEEATRSLESRYSLLEKPETLTRLPRNGLPDRGFTHFVQIWENSEICLQLFTLVSLSNK